MQSPDIHFESVEKNISENPLVIFHELRRNHTSPSTAYIKGEILFADGTVLAVFQHVHISETGTLITDYRYHCMDAEKEMIFRYDNAPHHCEIDTYPHHKHISDKIYACDMPDLKDVMDEITAFVIENMI
ncbi:toxin-antitoxin system TumE family protein [Desulfonema magnum]|uniref:Uncharacterized protein n=1 Tax=Desulfonema magnum TaxID=45655 RepID=A0A975BJB1_9BACT|nr:DUF6516 family protein [Desulfonema magnum]QTA86140.1 Uncharacterized protein dnm_021610 [Desulfonema magnum]